MPSPSSQFDHSARANCVLGIDPGLNRTGYAILERSSHGPVLREGGVIQSTKTLSLAERVLEIGRGVREVIAEFHPEVLAIEQVFRPCSFPRRRS